ncbi:MAG: hypothetical protein EPN53_17065 [Acidobacteria bacterium]|nr:MAG: hypothetical protein EPN53_17065 [Acidobacteriota bacterium]
MTENYLREVVPDGEILMHIQIRLRVSLDWNYGVAGTHQSLLALCQKDDRVFLDLLDLAASILGKLPQRSKALDEIDALLRAGGSAWMVGPDRRCLVRRVEPEAAQAAKEVIESSGRAGECLAEAWRQTYGRSPNASAGYREAVRAVEAAVCPIILPNNPKPTLGAAIAALRDAPPGKYATVFEDNRSGINPIDEVRGLMSLVWTNQLDRHGTDNPEVPFHVSQEQAEAVLFAALTLVHWFHRGFFRLVNG